MKFAAIIPARYASTRFPGKPLAVLGGKPVIIRVCEQAKKVFDHVFVATDDARIFDAVKEGGFIPIMTREDHKSGTDRCYEAFIKCGVKVDVVVNIQGDEPFIQPSQLQTIKSLFDSKVPSFLCSISATCTYTACGISKRRWRNWKPCLKSSQD